VADPNLILLGAGWNNSESRITPGGLNLFSLDIKRRLGSFEVNSPRIDQAEFALVYRVSEGGPGDRIFGLALGGLIEGGDEARQEFKAVNSHR